MVLSTLPSVPSPIPKTSSSSRLQAVCRRNKFFVTLKGNYVLISTVLSEKKDAEAPPKQISPEMITKLKSMVIFKDKHIIVLNKPRGIAVQGNFIHYFLSVKQLPLLSLIIIIISIQYSNCINLMKVHTIRLEVWSMLLNMTMMKHLLWCTGTTTEIRSLINLIRLDKETSGVLILARTKSAARILAEVVRV